MSTSITAPEIFDHFQQHKPSITIGGDTFWLVEGDLLMDQTQLWSYALWRVEQARAEGISSEQHEGLISMTDGHERIVRWRKGTLLTYCVRRHTFPSDQQYQIAVDGLHAATADWEATCGVNFRHLVESDTAKVAHGGLPLFDVAYIGKVTGFIATAFFPNDPVVRRHLYLYPSFFDGDPLYDPVGVLRHELGHVLGFRHEHIRSGAPADCPKEELMGYVAKLSDYDPRSVMHYFCGGVGSKDMQITDLDRSGARAVYGAPDHEVVYYD